MVTNMAWIAALLKPYDVAIHPNFSREEVVDTPGVLALLVSGDFRNYGRLTLPDPFGRDDQVPAWSPSDESESDLLRYAQQAITIGSLRDGADGLKDLCASGALNDFAGSTASALLGSVAFAELDDYSSCIALLDIALESVSDDSDDGRLCMSALLLQRGLRVSDSGKSDGVDDAVAAHRLLKNVDPGRVSSFKVSLGVGWTSAKTVRDIHEYLLDSAREALTMTPMQQASPLDPDRYSWQDRVRSAPSHIALVNDRRAGSGYESFVARMYKDRTRGTSSREVVFGDLDRGDSQLFAAQFADEISGHQSARRSRRELAEFRFLLARDAGLESPDLADILRLLRHAGEPDPLKAALNVIQAEGPLAAIQSDARSICRHRLQVSLLREPELRVLQAAADTLPKAAAAEALAVVLDAIAEGVPSAVAARWNSRSARLEPAWLAASALGWASDNSDLVAQALLDFIMAEVDDDQLLDRVLARSMRELDWEDLEEPTKRAWQDWALDGSHDHHAVREQVVSSLDLGAPTIGDASSLSLDDVAQGLNIQMSGGEFPGEWIDFARATVRQQLADIADKAASGAFGGGGVSVADVAVGLALYAGVDDLWPDIAAFMSNPLIQRADTSPAFDRLAVAADGVPTDLLKVLSDSKSALLFSTRDVFGTTLSPYPAALRCLARLSIVDSNELLFYCASLAGGNGPAGRHEAARVVTLACQGPQPADWIRSTAIQYSWDSLPEVRAEAARSLALLMNAASDGHELLEDRLIALLNEDGLLVPTLALRGLIDLNEPLGERTIDQVRTLSEAHPSRRVRRHAATLLGLDQSDRAIVLPTDPAS